VFLYEDECSMSNTAELSYKWSEKGKQPLIKQKQYKRERLTLFGSVNPVSGEVIVQKSESWNAKMFKKYLKKVIRHYSNSKGMIFMILDNVKFHHAKILKPFLENHKNKLKLIFLPPYSPDFNPIERVWWYMRKRISNNRYIDSLKNRMIAFWKMFSHYQKPNEFIVNLCNLNYSV
jgi:transposase